MKRLILLILCFIPLVAGAAIYRSVDKDGNVIFSDQPQPGAKQLKLPPIPTYSPPTPEPSSGKKKKTPAEAGYTHFSISQPSNDATIRSNTGTVQVHLSLKPRLHAGDHIVMKVDGQPYGGKLTTTQISFQNLPRGTHTIEAEVVGADGKVLISTSGVTIHLHRASRLLPNRSSAGGAPGSNPNPNVLSSNPNIRTSNPNIISSPTGTH